MLEPGSELFLEYPGTTGGRRHRGIVTHRAGDTVAVRFDGAAPPAAVGGELRAHFGGESSFSTQPARLVAASGTELELRLVGEAVPSERRASARVPADGSDLRVDFDDEIECRILDIGLHGLSVLARDRHVPGAIVDVVVHFDGERLTGRGAVKSAAPVEGGKVRYGIHLLESRGATLPPAIPRIRRALAEHVPV